MLTVWTRSSNDSEWQLYGVMTATQWNAEQSHIRFLRSMGPLYVKISHTA